MASIRQIEALVLRATPFSETSLIASLFSRQSGRVSVIAKGSRKPGTASAAALQPLHEISGRLYHGRGGELKTITQLDLVTDRPGITKSAHLFGIASRSLELVQFQTPMEEPAPPIYHLLHEFLAILEDTPPPRASTMLLAFEFRLQALLGYGFQTDRCARCGIEINETPGVLSSSAGGMLCRNCRKGMSDLVTMEASDIPVLNDMLTAPFRLWLNRAVSARFQAVLARTTSDIWQFHTPEHRRSASLAFLAELGSEPYMHRDPYTNERHQSGA